MYKCKRLEAITSRLEAIAIEIDATAICGKLKSLVIQSFPVVTVKVTMQVLGVYELKL